MFTVIAAIISLGLVFVLNIGYQKHYLGEEDRLKRRNPTGPVPSPDLPNLPNPKYLKLLYLFPALVFVSGFFHGMFFYAQPGYIYHVRTIAGTEKVIDGSDIGYKIKGFGFVNDWKKAMSVQASNVGRKAEDADVINAEKESVNLSATLQPKRVVFLDQVDAHVSATARWMLPTDEASFLKIAREYRTPENLLRTELLPAFLETLDANAALMDAEDYFSGGLTRFNNDFKDQMEHGTFMVNRVEKFKTTPHTSKSTANASLDDQENYDEGQQVDYVVEKVVDSNNLPVRKIQAFAGFGILTVSARITSVIPNRAFADRMTLKQKASADRAIAREQRIQEEEQELLAKAKGQREVAERQAAALVKQIEQTTDAETDKQLAITKAEQARESEAILLEAARIELDRAKIDAQAVKVTADAQAHAKKAIIQADNALEYKGQVYKEVQKYWADAFAQRQVPSIMMGGSTDKNGIASNGEFNAVEGMIAAMLAKDLKVNMNMEK